MSIDRRRGYIRVNREESPQLVSWDLPDYSEQNPQPRETAMNYDPTWAEPSQDLTDEHEEPQPLTAADLEAIRQSAYEEGLEQGKQEGFPVGLEQGLEQGRAQGREEGQAEGREQGLADAQSDIQAQVDQLLALVERLATPLADVDQQVEQTLANMVVMLARELFQVELATNPQIILHTVREAVAALPQHEVRTRLQLHPDDLAIVENAYGAAHLADRQWVLLAEPSLERGDVIVEAGDSSVSFLMKQRIHDLLHGFIGRNNIDEIDDAMIAASSAAQSAAEPAVELIAEQNAVPSADAPSPLPNSHQAVENSTAMVQEPASPDPASLDTAALDTHHETHPA
uniref:flagellar assembly protein FliH n=1 Tax=Thaumasiovibrio occultus TaxID=1891184 RepID=UPI000B3500F1|nr:flagellar assembly protein FliH [Thaumasiovibrio occultus]